MSLADHIVSLLRCPGCGHQQWDLRAQGIDDLPRLEGTLCCGNCGQAFAARGGVLDMIPGFVEDRVAALRRRLESPGTVRFYEEHLRHGWTPLASRLRDEDRRAWLVDHAPQGSPGRIIDFGCGRGADLEVMREACRPDLAIGVDLSPVLLAEAAREARSSGVKNSIFLKADLEHLPLAPDSIGWGACYGVLHRLGSPARGLAVMARTLERGGMLTGLTTHRVARGALGAGQRVFGTLGRVHLFRRADLERMTREADLDLEAWQPWGPVALLAARRRAAR